MNRIPRFRAAAIAALLGFLLSIGASAAPSAAAPQAAPKAAAAQPAAIDVNRASAADLQSVPGIGKSLAQRIVDFRDKNGPFGKVEDLLKVQGIGEKSLERLRPYLTVGKAS
jgi:competence protein ComEA